MRLQLTFYKSRYIVAGLLMLFLKLKSQDVSAVFQKKEVAKTEIELLYAHYSQKGNHSAVTGGQGTEALTVYAPSLKVKHHFKKGNSLTFRSGIDVISSASVDNIDFVISSASRRDGHSYANLTYESKTGVKNTQWGIGSGLSIESDYLSLPFNVFVNFKTEKRFYEMSFAAFFDDLRWGRLNAEYKRPVELIYPKELRGEEWFDNHTRQSYNLFMGMAQPVTNRLFLGIYPGIIYQTGLLSTSFHRVYFNNGTLKVENLPDRRFKIPLTTRYNYNLNERFKLKGGYAFSFDNFGIVSHQLSFEPVFSPVWKVQLKPVLRFYKQTPSDYFQPYRQHNPESEFYTSDFDLAKFYSIKAGMGVAFSPYKYVTKRSVINNCSIRYSYYFRNDGLKAHVVTLLLTGNYIKD